MSILTLVEGIEYSLEHGQPVVTALWLDMVDRAAIMEELTAVDKFLGSDKLLVPKSSAWGGYAVPPTMLSPHFRDLGGAAALGPMAAFGGASAPGVFGGFSGSPAWGG